MLVKSLTTMRDFLSYLGLLCGNRHWGLDGGWYVKLEDNVGVGGGGRARS